MALLNRSQILEAKDIKTKDIEVKEWDGTIRIKQLSAKEYNDITMNMVNIRKMAAKQLSKKNADENLEDAINEIAIKNQKILLLIKSIVDENMKPLFSEADMELLYQKNTNVIDKIIAEIEEFNAVSSEDAKKNLD
ncbi:hypothetical protein TSYNTROOL_14380 [Tepidanaerobacter syntrophicus]|uniref:hypothetical protein n=1 Tax=Tepidanaerobacter syntrophicus TaxID=224999 RepID=UPI0022EF6B85|nr:hypothetical protein [Tepidanaerobacter syntrophicus]GLI51352.1 hypothetical protein TSYNTROOL_14380 [Tepidanaerobacter syntrophicus]